jgi:hypothetical protein
MLYRFLDAGTVVLGSRRGFPLDGGVNEECDEANVSVSAVSVKLWKSMNTIIARATTASKKAAVHSSAKPTQKRPCSRNERISEMDLRNSAPVISGSS